jgi:hypothetical protein
MGRMCERKMSWAILRQPASICVHGLKKSVYNLCILSPNRYSKSGPQDKNAKLLIAAFDHLTPGNLVVAVWWNKTRYEGASKSFRTGRLEREMQMVQLPATRCSCIAILWVSLVNYTAITLCVASERVSIVVVYFVIDSVRKLLDIPSYIIWTDEDN